MSNFNILKFDDANKNVIDKDVAIRNYVKYMLSRTQAMFSYSGLPDTIPASQLELLLQTSGHAFITKVNDDLYALDGSLGGPPDPYGDYTTITVSNVALNLSKQYDLSKDGVLINNDTLRQGIMPILYKYGCLLSENMLTMRTVDIILRMVCMISASDDRTYQGATKFIQDIEKGKISAIGESAFFDGVKLHTVSNSQNYMNQFIEYEQYLKASCFNEIGLNANYNMKGANITSEEASLNDDFLLPLVDNMMKERQTAIAKINDMYGTNISIDYASAWQVTHMENEKEKAISETITKQVDEGTDVPVSISQKPGAHDLNRPLIDIGGNADETKSNDTEKSEPDNEESEQTDAPGTDDTTAKDDGTTGTPDDEQPTDGGTPDTEVNQETDSTDDEKDGDDDDRDKG